jgi:hypothetical protein
LNFVDCDEGTFAEGGNLKLFYASYNLLLWALNPANLNLTTLNPAPCHPAPNKILKHFVFIATPELIFAFV